MPVLGPSRNISWYSPLAIMVWCRLGILMGLFANCIADSPTCRHARSMLMPWYLLPVCYLSNSGLVPWGDSQRVGVRGLGIRSLGKRPHPVAGKDEQRGDVLCGMPWEV